MKNLNLNYFIYLIVACSILILFIFLKISESEEVTFTLLVSIIPKIVSIDLLIITVFVSYCWRWKIFRTWLVPFPNINGTWKGTIQTTWVDPITNQRPSPIPTVLTIKQSFFKISCVMRTGEMTSNSIIADFILDRDNQIIKLSYIYDSNPIATVKERSPQHLGTMIFSIIETPTIKKLEGEYWTARKTTGHIELIFSEESTLSKKLEKHPVSEVRNYKS